MIEQTSIWVTFQKEGIHCYPDAPEEVAYLRQPHRHVFHFKVKTEVFHDDRELEFHMLKNELQALYTDDILKLDYLSCEMMARELAEYIKSKNPDRNFYVDVSEDGECGARIEWRK